MCVYCSLSFTDFHTCTYSNAVSRATLKRVCRLYNISRWPPKNNDVKCSRSRQMKSILLAEEDIDANTKGYTIKGAKVCSRVTEIPDGTAVNAKVKYGDVMLKLKLSVSSKMKDLEEDAAKRLNLSIEIFVLNYVDKEGDKILTNCDEDLTECFLHCRTLESTTVKMFITPKS